MVAHCNPGAPEHRWKCSAGTAGSVNGGDDGSASVPRVGSLVGSAVGAAVLELHPVAAQTAAISASRVHTLGRTEATLSCPPMQTRLSYPTGVS